PLTILNPKGLPTPAVLTFHDAQHEFLPEMLPARELRRRRRTYGSSLAEAKIVIAISRHVRASLVERFQVPDHKIRVIYHGIDQIFSEKPDGREEDVAGKYGIRGRPFMIYPASTWPHKNHATLLCAFRKFVAEVDDAGEAMLLLTGGRKNAHPDLVRDIAKLELEDRVDWLGYIPREDLASLYRMARMMVFPSLFEGFGLPVLEAQASGCPVLCSSASSLPEVGGDAACYFEPTSVSDLVACMTRLWLDPGERERMRRSGLKRAARFTWTETARQTVAAYQAAVRAGGVGRPD
ncbi:MAG: glycosyltransferase family 1 protein, partial [Deltaproteobacteria bacterium]